jgi:hypothetical protein
MSDIVWMAVLAVLLAWGSIAAALLHPPLSIALGLSAVTSALLSIRE